MQEAGQSEKSKGTGVNHANAADKKREERPNFDKSGTRNDGWDRDGDFNAMGTREAIDQEKLQKAMAEEREKRRQEARLQGKQVIIDQIQDRYQYRIKESEMRERER